MATRYRITLTEEERKQLRNFTRSGKTNAPKFIHARALLLRDVGPHAEESWKVADVATALGVSARTIEHLKQRFVEEGFDAALARKPSAKKPTSPLTAGSMLASPHLPAHLLRMAAHVGLCAC